MLFVSFAVMFKQRLVLSRKQRKAQAKLCPGPPRQIWEPLMAHGSSQNVPHYLFWHLCRGCCMTKASSISSCISGPTDMSRSELKAETTCAEPPDNAATSLDTSRCSHIKLSHICCSGMHPGTKHRFVTISTYDTHYKLYSLSNICI